MKKGRATARPFSSTPAANAKAFRQRLQQRLPRRPSNVARRGSCTPAAIHPAASSLSSLCRPFRMKSPAAASGCEEFLEEDLGKCPDFCTQARVFQMGEPDLDDIAIEFRQGDERGQLLAVFLDAVLALCNQEGIRKVRLMPTALSAISYRNGAAQEHTRKQARRPGG